ncbi:MAG: hypothetical protein U5R31_13205 [Acidimicrobiia bacterium]|nr:hypothetical protein [Acidimicrobiia bacterium]
MRSARSRISPRAWTRIALIGRFASRGELFKQQKQTRDQLVDIDLLSTHRLNPYASLRHWFTSSPLLARREICIEGALN